MEFAVRQATSDDGEWIARSFPEMGWNKPEGHFQDILAQQQRGTLVLIVAETSKADYAGHVQIVWEPHSAWLREQEIPEIQDLNVLPKFRRNGVGTALIDEAERTGGQRSPRVGIRVGLSSEYGPAQAMYPRRGYMPDGRGALYRDEPVNAGQEVRFDDDLVISLVKDL